MAMLSVHELKQNRENRNDRNTTTTRAKRSEYNYKRITIRLGKDCQHNLNSNNTSMCREKKIFRDKISNKRTRPVNTMKDQEKHMVGVSYMVQNGQKQIISQQTILNINKNQEKNRRETFIERLQRTRQTEELNTNNTKESSTADPPFFMRDLHERGKNKSTYKPWEYHKQQIEQRRNHDFHNRTRLELLEPLKILPYKNKEDNIKGNNKEKKDWIPDEAIVDLQEEAELRQSIQKCQIWLKKYFF